MEKEATEKSTLRNKSIGTKVSEEEYAALEKLAEARGLTLGEWLREHYNYQQPHSALADRTPAAFAELHRSQEKSSTLIFGRALQSLLIEPLECAKTASAAGERTFL